MLAQRFGGEVRIGQNIDILDRNGQPQGWYIFAGADGEALEAFPLDALRLVGTISSAGVTYALIQAPDGVVYRVTHGAHLGQNYGEIDGISENGVLLTEIVPDGLGGYIRRPATIAPSR